MMTLDAARAEYKQIRDAALTALGFSVERFNTRAQSLAMELADGEQVEPRHWVQAARMLAAGE